RARHGDGDPLAHVVPKHLPTLHHEVDVLDRGHVCRRVSGHGDKIGEEAGLDLAAIGEVEDRRITGGGCDHDVGGGHSAALHRLHLEPVLAVGEDADVAAHADP